MSYVERTQALSEGQKIHLAVQQEMKKYTGSRQQQAAAGNLLDAACSQAQGRDVSLSRMLDLARDSGISQAGAEALVDLGTQMGQVLKGHGR